MNTKLVTIARIILVTVALSWPAFAAETSEAQKQSPTSGPPEVTNVNLSRAAAGTVETRILWSPVPTATGYSIIRSPRAQFGHGEQCWASQLSATTFVDPYDPDPTGSYYFIRANTSSLTGTWGFDSSDLERLSSACPPPGGPCAGPAGPIPIPPPLTSVRFCATTPASCTGRQWPFRASFKACWDAYNGVCVPRDNCGTTSRCGVASRGEQVALTNCQLAAMNTCGNLGVSCECEYTVPAGTDCECDCMDAGDTGLWTKEQAQ